MTATNEITQEELKNKLIYFQEKGYFIWKKLGNRAGYIREDGYKFIRINNKLYREHRLAWLYVYGEMPSKEIDHIDGNPSNNSINNLRLCTSTQNKCNTKIRKDNTSGMKGVHWYKAYENWHVKLTYNKETKNLGYFKDFFEACCAVASERNKVHKEFANHG